MLQNAMARLQAVRTATLVGYDVVVWLVSFLALAWAQAQLGSGDGWSRLHLLLTAGLSAAAFVSLGATVRLHQGRATCGSFEEAGLVAWVGLLTGTLTGVVSALNGGVGDGVLLLSASVTAVVLMLWGRGTYRMVREHRFGSARGTEPALVVGAGEGGRQLMHAMAKDPAATWLPVGLVDDDPSVRHRRIRSLPVLGTTQDLADLARRTGATTAVIAIPSASSEAIRRISRRASDAGLAVKVVPGPSGLHDPSVVALDDVRDMDVTDLLGRHTIDTDVTSIAGYLTGKRVLVTGAGGSIGSELCRQISRFDPAELIMLDRDESALHAVQLSLTGRALLDSDDTVLGDIRDLQFVADLFAERRPEVVFHAAALKHLPLLEKAPGEAVKTNVWGTLTVLEAAAAYGVERFVNISTDKAANPCSVLGYSKRLAEGLTTAVAEDAEGTFLSVRFGNVLGSRGSVLTAFTSQIAAGGPVTVTHRDVTRYFMTIAEAVELVIQAAAIGRDGEALVLDMGKAVSIDGVARQLIEMSGKDVEVVYTGMRSGEKMHEELFGDHEPDVRPAHPLISHTPVPALSPLEARELDPWAPGDDVIEELHRSCEGMARQLADAKNPVLVRIQAKIDDALEAGLHAVAGGKPDDDPTPGKPSRRRRTVRLVASSR